MGQICKYLFRICAFRICAQGLQDSNILQVLKLLLGTRYQPYSYWAPELLSKIFSVR